VGDWTAPSSHCMLAPTNIPLGPLSPARFLSGETPLAKPTGMACNLRWAVVGTSVHTCVVCAWAQGATGHRPYLLT
jgi:hypothetical protein